MLQQKPKPAPKGKPVDPTQPREVGPPLNPPAQIARVRFSPCGTVLAAACFDAVVRRWDVTGDAPKELPPLAGHGGWVTGLAFSPDKSPRLYAADSWGKVTARDAATAADAKPRWAVDAAHAGWVRTVAVSPDGATVATCGRDGFVRLWASADGAKVGECPVPADPLTLCFAPDGRSLLVGDLAGVVRQLALPGLKAGRTFEAKELYRLDRMQEVGGVRCLAFDAAGKTLAVAGAVPNSGGFVTATPLVAGFDWATGKRTFTLKGASEKEGYVTDLRWHPTGHYLLATTSGQPGNGQVVFWKPAEAKPFVVVPRANAHSLDLHPDGRRLVASATNGNSSGNGRPKGKGGPHDYPANFSPIHFWDMPTAGT